MRDGGPYARSARGKCRPAGRRGTGLVLDPRFSSHLSQHFRTRRVPYLSWSFIMVSFWTFGYAMQKKKIVLVKTGRPLRSDGAWRQLCSDAAIRRQWRSSSNHMPFSGRAGRGRDATVCVLIVDRQIVRSRHDCEASRVSTVPPVPRSRWIRRPVASGQLLPQHARYTCFSQR